MTWYSNLNGLSSPPTFLAEYLNSGPLARISISGTSTGGALTAHMTRAVKVHLNGASACTLSNILTTLIFLDWLFW